MFVPLKHRGYVLALAFSPDGQYLLITTEDSEYVASAAVQVIRQYNYWKAIPDLMSALQVVKPSKAAKIADLLRTMIPSNEPQERKKLAFLMTEALEGTMDSSFASVATTIIREFEYKDALPALREAISTAPLGIATHMANVLVAFNDKGGINTLRDRIESDRSTSDYNFMVLVRALYELQAEQSVELLIKCFKEGQASVQTYWIDFFKEKRIVKAREAVQSIRDSTKNDSVRQKANEFLSAIR